MLAITAKMWEGLYRVKNVRQLFEDSRIGQKCQQISVCYSTKMSEKDLASLAASVLKCQRLRPQKSKNFRNFSVIKMRTSEQRTCFFANRSTLAITLYRLSHHTLEPSV